MKRSKFKLTFTQKLLTTMLFVGITPLLANGILMFTQTSSELKKTAVEHLDSVREVKKNQIEDYFSQIRKQAQTMAENPMVIDAAKNFTSSFHALPDELDINPQQLIEYKKSLAEYYKNYFGSEFEKQTGQTLDAAALLPTTPEGIISQHQYIVKNPNPIGDKHKLDAANDQSSYDQHHKQYHPIFRSFLEKFGYYDIFLIDPATGEIVYSVFKEVDFATNLKSGPHSKSNFASGLRSALKGANGSIHIMDFKPYLPSYNAPASFIASPVYAGSQLVGILAFQMPVDKINTIMQEKTGMGESGETYLVGDDLLMRSQSRFSDEPTLGILRIDTEGVKAVLAGQTGSGIFNDYRSTPVLSSYTPLSIEGLHWGLLAEIDKSEALANIRTTRNQSLIIISISLLLIIVISLMMSRNVRKQLGGDPADLQEVANAMLHGDINSDMTTDKKHIGVFATMLAVHNKMSSQIESDRILVAENSRIKQALDNTSSNVMVADNDYNIIYLNKAVTEMFKDAETDFRNDLPNFDTSKLLGRNIDSFHKNPAHQRVMLDKLTSTYTGNLEIGGRNMRLIATPVLDTEGKRLGIVVEWLDRTQEVAIENEIQDIVSSAQAGDLSRRIDLSTQEGFTHRLSEGINQLVKVCGETIDETVQVMGAVAQGDLTRKIESEYEGSFGQLKNDVNETIEKLTEVMGDINSSATSVLSSSQEIAQGNTDLSQRTEQQASSLEETASSMEEMTSTVRQNADNARQANQLAAGTREQAEQGGKVVSQAVTAMTGITESSNKIAAIIGVIDEIAFQTNLLALNAAVEAARAGEQGRGFAVVASEVRNLAGRSATAAKEIKELIEDSVVKVEQGSKLVDASGQTLEEIMTSVKKVSDIIAEIAAASMEQSEGIEQVNKAISQMDEMTQQNAALVEEAAAASESMGEQAGNLNEMVGFFKTGNTTTGFSGAERRKAERPWSEQATTTAASVKPANQTKTVKAVSNAADSNEWEEF